MIRHPHLPLQQLVFVACLTVALCHSPAGQARPLPEAAPSAVGMRAHFTDDIDRVVAERIERGKLPGCVVVVGRRGALVHKRAYGNRRLEPSVEPMTLDTVFDLASLTKPIAASTSVMQLIEHGDLQLRDQVTDFFPEFAAHGKGETTIEHLLVHSAGLIPDNPIGDFTDGWASALEKICDLEPLSPPGERFKYSDNSFLLLGAIVAKVAGTPLDEYVVQNIFKPLGMRETMYNPPEELRSRAATTEQVDGRWLRGVVHDPRARLLDGVAGHAGLFSTAEDLAIFAQTLLDGGKRNGRRILSPQTIQEWTTPRRMHGNQRGLGWDMGSAYSRNRGEMMSDRAFGHGGFTGTAIWIDPQLDLFVIFLSNRVHPNGKGEANSLAGRIGTIASAACLATPDRQFARARGENARQVELGIDVLAARNYDILRGKRVGLIANHTSHNAQRKSTIDLLAEAPEVNLVALFSPEHGIRGTLDQSHITDTVDEQTKLPVFSLYGESRKPTPEHMEQIDVMVFDIQDIGCRFYTYLSTMGLAMEAAAEHGKQFVVLDRPNPIGGQLVEGPVLDKGSESFVGYHQIPVRHGMTLGELARLIREERKLDLELTIVEVQGWNRSDYLYSTGLPWTDTSPNMRSLTEAVLYPGVGLFETTNVSVGRGTDTPFEVLGAPWLDGQLLAKSIAAYAPPGVRVVPVRFTPTTSTHKGTACEGVNFVVTDWQTFRSLDLAWAIGASLVEHYRDEWQAERFPRLLGSKATFDALLEGAAPKELKGGYQPQLKQFKDIRARYLLY